MEGGRSLLHIPLNREPEIVKNKSFIEVTLGVIIKSIIKSIKLRTSVFALKIGKQSRMLCCINLMAYKNITYAFNKKKRPKSRP